MKKIVGQIMNRPIPWIWKMKNGCHSKSLPRKTKWKKEKISDIHFDDIKLPVPIIQQNVTPVGLFEHFFDDYVIASIVNLSNWYANAEKGKHEFKTNASEICLFIVTLLLTGYNTLLRRKLYWENSSDVHNAAMSNTMSCNRFEEIFSILHLKDNVNLDKQDKMTKIRPFYDMTAKRCFENRPNSSDLSIDESMLPYYCQNKSKQRNKSLLSLLNM